MTSDRVDSDLLPAPMTAVEPLAAAVADALVGRALLSHPFYRRWEAGQLQPGELPAYAVNYRAFEAALPVVLAEVVDRLREDGRLGAAAMVERSLADELGRPEPHLALFDRFAGALPDGPAETSPGPAAHALVDTYLELAAEGPVATLAGLAAYETQAAAIAASKSDGLRRWYGLDAGGTEFWDVHAEMDADHGEWALEALALAGAAPDEVIEAARRAADGWWALLDEREDEAPGSARLGAHH